MTDIFLSYKREDREQARKLAEALIVEGYSVWWDIELLPGAKFADEINEVLNATKLIIVLWTPEATNSDWVKSEAMVGLQRGNLIPIMLRETTIPVPFNSLHVLDFTDWTSNEGAEFNLLLKALSARSIPSIRLNKRETEEEIKQALDKPEHEVEFWTSITDSQDQRIEEYELYLERYGDDGSFSKLAERRIQALKKTSKAPKKVKEFITILSVIMGILVGGFTIANMLGVFEKEKALKDFACSYIDIKKLNWSSGHKTNFCIAAGYEQGNFNQGEYKNGGICMTGPLPDVCRAAYTGGLGPEYMCQSEGSLIKCYKK